MTVRIMIGDALSQLAKLPDESVHCVVTSPPYWGLRTYKGGPGMIGLEPTFDEHLENLVAVFREVRRVLRSDGTLWLNYGDAYVAGQGGRQSAVGEMPKKVIQKRATPRKRDDVDVVSWSNRDATDKMTAPSDVWKPKDLMMMPARVAIALQADGWWLRSEIIWHKSNPTPESCRDRPTSAHEKMFLLTKAARYFYDAEAVKEPVSGTANARASKHNSIEARKARVNPEAKHTVTAERRGVRAPGVGPKSAEPGQGIKANKSFSAAVVDLVPTRSPRNVWKIATAPYREAHFATFPPALVEPCIKAGTSAKGVCGECGAPPSCECDAPTVPATCLDIFAGSGTVGLVADRLQRDAILIEISPEYAEMARRRVGADVGGLFGPVTESR